MEERKNPKDSIESFSEEELKKEADSVRKMIDQSPELQNLTVPEEVHQRLAERIKKYEEEKALEGLSEKDREALRIGREIQKRNEEKTASDAAFGNDSREEFKDDSENKKVLYRPKKRKTVFVLAAVLLVVFGMGLTSVGRKDIVVDVFQKTFGSGDKTYVDTEEIKDTTEITEQEAYSKIEETFGTKVVQMTEKPKNTEFLELQLDEGLQEAVLYYLVGEKIFSCRMVARYVESSIGMEMHDKLLREYILSLPETEVLISEYEILESSELEYTAKFTYNNIEYFFKGIMKQEDIEKIIKNLFFF